VLESSNVAVLERPGTLPDELISAWDQTVEEVMENQIRLGSLLRHTRLVSLDGDIVLIDVPDSFHERMLRSERHLLAQKLSGMSKLEIKDIHFDVSATLAESLEAPNDDQFDARAALMKKCEENPAVQSLVERFGGEVVW
jgi:hypothetical protein